MLGVQRVFARAFPCAFARIYSLNACTKFNSYFYIIMARSYIIKNESVKINAWDSM